MAQPYQNLLDAARMVISKETAPPRILYRLECALNDLSNMATGAVPVMVRKLQDLRQQIDGMPVDSEDVTPLLEQLAGMQMECKSLDGVVGLLAAEKSRIRELLSPPPPAPKDQQQSEEVTA